MSNRRQNDEDDDSRAIIRRRPIPSRRRRDGLIQYARDNTSQNGEDGIIENFFDCLVPAGCTGQHYCVDVGAWDGKHLSNTYSLLTSSKTRWTGLFIEADPVKFRDLQALHANSNAICVQTTISVNPNRPTHHLTCILQQYPEIPRNFDFLCIDIDGSDYWVLYDLLSTTDYRPKLMVIEFNPTMPNDLVYIPPRSDRIRHGASLAALVELMERYDYILVETTLFNAFFVPRHIYQTYLKEIVKSTAIQDLHEVTMGTELYQLYDGTLKLHGCKKLLWHRLALDENKLQILNEDERRFPFAPTGAGVEWDRSNVVDMSAYCGGGNNGEKQQCAQALRIHLQQHGFVLVSGTGIPKDLCHHALQSTKAFLSDVDESVRRSCLTQDRARRGYSPMCTENFASLIGEHGLNDLVKKFRIGPETENDNPTNSSLLQPNVWPSRVTWEGAEDFQSTITEYYTAACHAANAIVTAITDGLLQHYPELTDVLEVLSQNDQRHSLPHTSILTLLGYKVGTRHKGKNKSPLVAAHTDVGVVTMLIFDSPGCAQLQRAESTTSAGFVDVNLPFPVPTDPVFVVNIGDCLSELCQKKLPSTLHQVIADRRHKNPRHCLALFMGLDPEARLTVDGDEMSYEEWRKRRIMRAQDVLKTTKAIKEEES